LNCPFPFTHATTKLEKIAEGDEYKLTRQLAMSIMCNKLKSVDLIFAPSIPTSSSTSSSTTSNIFSELKNMPVLETLKLRQFRVKLKDLEMVHHNVPSIKCLCLRKAIIVSGEFPNNITPAKPITKLDLELAKVANSHTHIELYKYLVKKYPSVSKPTFQDDVLADVDEDYARDVYNKGFIPWYQKIGSKVDTLSFDSYCDGLDVFRKFDDSGIKLKKLKIRYMFDNYLLLFEELAQSQQSKYIQKLTLRYVIPWSWEMMINMEVLTYLEISFGDLANDDKAKDIINFSDFVEACPATLTHVEIKRVTLTFNKSASNITSIRSLKLTDVDTKPGAAIMGVNFPKLSKLRVYAFTKGNFTISLPSNHLKEADIHTNYPQNKGYSLSINTMYGGRPQRTVIWPMPNNGSRGEMYCSDKSDSGLKSDWAVDFTCASVEKLTYSIIKNEDEHDDDEYLY
jgi:hypothetical protein